jgi:hypothetical protein
VPPQWDGFKGAILSVSYDSKYSYLGNGVYRSSINRRDGWWGTTELLVEVIGPCEFMYEMELSGESSSKYATDRCSFSVNGSYVAGIDVEENYNRKNISLPAGVDKLCWNHSIYGDMAAYGSSLADVKIPIKLGSEWVRDVTLIYSDYQYLLGGDKIWKNCYDNDFVGLRSGAITNNQSSWIEMTVPGPGK